MNIKTTLLWRMVPGNQRNLRRQPTRTTLQEQPQTNTGATPPAQPWKVMPGTARTLG